MQTMGNPNIWLKTLSVLFLSPVKIHISVKFFFTLALLHVTLNSCYILSRKVATLYFASKVVTFRVSVTFCVNCYSFRRNKLFSLHRRRNFRQGNMLLKFSTVNIALSNGNGNGNDNDNIIILSNNIW